MFLLSRETSLSSSPYTGIFLCPTFHQFCSNIITSVLNHIYFVINRIAFDYCTMLPPKAHHYSVFVYKIKCKRIPTNDYWINKINIAADHCTDGERDKWTCYRAILVLNHTCDFKLNSMRSARLFNFEITYTISDQTALNLLQIPFIN